VASHTAKLRVKLFRQPFLHNIVKLMALAVASCAGEVIGWHIVGSPQPGNRRYSWGSIIHHRSRSLYQLATLWLLVRYFALTPIASIVRPPSPQRVQICPLFRPYCEAMPGHRIFTSSMRRGSGRQPSARTGRWLRRRRNREWRR